MYFFSEKNDEIFFLKKMGENAFLLKKKEYIFFVLTIFLRKIKRRMTTYFDAQADYFLWFNNVNKQLKSAVKPICYF